MGEDKPRDRAELHVEFAHVLRDDAIGASVHMKCEFCRVPEAKDIPKLPTRTSILFGSGLISCGRTTRTTTVSSPNTRP